MRRDLQMSKEPCFSILGLRLEPFLHGCATDLIVEHHRGTREFDTFESPDGRRKGTPAQISFTRRRSRIREKSI